jgi:hypothetical protein
MAIVAWRLCKHARGTKAFTLSLFVSIPIIYEPFNFVFIFGGLDSNYSQLLFWAGLLNMMQRYLESVKPARESELNSGYQTVTGPVREMPPVLIR